MVMRRRLRDRTCGLATLKAPVPFLPVSMSATSKFCPVGPVLVSIVAVARSTGVIGSRLLASSPDCAESTMVAPFGICACQSNSLQAGNVPAAHEAVKSSVNVAGWNPVVVDGGGGGGALSGDTYAVR